MSEVASYDTQLLAELQVGGSDVLLPRGIWPRGRAARRASSYRNVAVDPARWVHVELLQVTPLQIAALWYESVDVPSGRFAALVPRHYTEQGMYHLTAVGKESVVNDVMVVRGWPGPIPVRGEKDSWGASQSITISKLGNIVMVDDDEIVGE